MSCRVSAVGHQTLIANCRPGMSTRAVVLAFLRSPKASNQIRHTAIAWLISLKKNDLMLTDLGYFKLSVFQKLIEKEAYFLSKLLTGTTLRNADTLEKIDLSTTLHSFDGNALEMDVIMANDKHQVPCRLIGLRV